MTLPHLHRAPFKKAILKNDQGYFLQDLGVTLLHSCLARLSWNSVLLGFGYLPAQVEDSVVLGRDLGISAAAGKAEGKQELRRICRAFALHRGFQTSVCSFSASAVSCFHPCFCRNQSWLSMAFGGWLSSWHKRYFHISPDAHNSLVSSSWYHWHLTCFFFKLNAVFTVFNSLFTVLVLDNLRWFSWIRLRKLIYNCKQSWRLLYSWIN